MKKECPPKCKENFLAVPEAILAIPFAQRCFLTIIKPSLGLLTIVHFSSSIVVRSSHTFLMKGTSVDFFSCLKECTMLMLEKWYDSVIEECADMFLLRSLKNHLGRISNHYGTFSTTTFGIMYIVH